MSTSEFRMGLNEAVSLWKRRSSLLPECDVTADWEDQLSDIENRYRAQVAALAPLTPRHVTELESALQPQGPARQVAVHLLMSSGSEMLERTCRLADDRASRCYLDVAEMTRFCDEAVFDSVVAALISRQHPRLLEALTSPIAGRGAKQFESALASSVIDANGKPSTHITRGLAQLGARQLVPQLESMLSAIPRTDDFYTATTLARALYWLQSPAGRQFYQAEIQREDMQQYDLTLWYALFSAPSDVEFLSERIATTCSIAWKEQLLRALGIVGSPRAVPLLISHLREDAYDIRAAANEALERILGTVTEIDPEENDAELQQGWRIWWDEHAGAFDVASRYRDGERLSLTCELQGLNHPLAEERKHHYEHLVVYTGQYFPFDYQTYYAWQKQAVVKWREWLGANAERFPAGGWW